MPARSAKAEKPRLSNVVADRITRDMVVQQVSPGSVIGLEPDLMRRFGVSRATLREAIRQIEARGVATMRRGAGGGLIAVGTPRTIAARTLSTYLEVSDITLREQACARNLLETIAAGLAAQRASGAQIADLRAAVAQWKGVTDPVQARRLHFALREQIAEVSGNPMLALTANAFYRVTVDLSALLTGPPFVVARYIAEQAAQKNDLVEVIASGDAAAAMELVRREGAALLTAETFLPYLDVALPDLVLKSGQSAATDRNEEEKLGIATALRLRREIATLGWPVGENIGTEQQLSERYGISRTLLREALMLLEINGIVRLLRGRVGGVIVGKPDPQASIHTIVSHLHYLDLIDDDLRGIVCAIDVMSAGRAANVIEVCGVERLFNEAYTAKRGFDYAIIAQGIRAVAANSAMDVICNIAGAYSDEAARPNAEGADHWEGFRQALLARDAALAERRMRGLWGQLQ